MPGALSSWYQTFRALSERLDQCGASQFATSATAVLGHCTHLMCNRLGVPVSEEAVLHYLVGRTLAESEPAAGSEG
jgi:hypothetical protein